MSAEQTDWDRDLPSPDRGRPAQICTALSDVPHDDIQSLLWFLCGYAPDAVREACKALTEVPHPVESLRKAADS